METKQNIDRENDTLTTYNNSSCFHTADSFSKPFVSLSLYLQFKKAIISILIRIIPIKNTFKS